MVSVCAVVTLSAALTGSLRADVTADAFIAHQLATKTFAADLEQTFHWTFPRKHVESVGRIYYQAPDLLALLLTNPVTETVIVRGEDLYIKRDRKPTVHRKLEHRDGRPTQNVQFLLAFFQNGATNYIHLFNTTMAQTTNTMEITLAPKHPIRMFPLRKVTNVLSLPGLDIQLMNIGLIWDSYIAYKFTHPVRNRALDPALFTPP